MSIGCANSQSSSQVLYTAVMQGSYDDVMSLSTEMNPTHLAYESQIDQVFEVILYWLTIANRTDSDNGLFAEITARLVSLCLTVIFRNRRSVDLSSRFIEIWPSLWENLGIVIIPRVTYKKSIEVQERLTWSSLSLCCISSAGTTSSNRR